MQLSPEAMNPQRFLDPVPAVEHSTEEGFVYGKAPSAPVVASGPTTCIKVPPGSPGTTIHVPHPQVKGSFIPVAVPATAHAGQAMLVPIPPATEAVPAPPLAPSAPPAPTAPELALPAAPADLCRTGHPPVGR